MKAWRADGQRRLLENARLSEKIYQKKDRRHWREGGEGGHRGKLQREDYRQLGYQATISLLELPLASKRAIHVVRELFVLRRIGNIIIGVIASQNPSRIQKGWWAVSAATPRVRARTWIASKHWRFIGEAARSSLTIWGMFLKSLSPDIRNIYWVLLLLM